MLQVEGELLRMIAFAQLLAGLTQFCEREHLQVRNAADDAALVDCKKGHRFEVLKIIL